MRTRLVISFVLMLTPLAASAAPAPLPRTSTDVAEVVFDAQTKERAHLAQVRLRPFLQGHDATLDVSSGGTLLRLRLSGRPDALAIIHAVAGHLSDPFASISDGEKKARQRLGAAALRDEFARRMQAVRQIRIRKNDDSLFEEAMREIEQSLSLHEFEAEPLKIASPPRGVRRAR